MLSAQSNIYILGVINDKLERNVVYISVITSSQATSNDFE